VDHEVEVEVGDVVGGLVVVGVETVAGDGVGDDAALGKGVVVRALEEVLVWVGVGGEGCAVLGQSCAEVGALVASEPEGAVGQERVGSANHLELEVGGDFVERQWGVVEEVSVAEAAEFLRPEEDEEDGAAGSGAVGEGAGELEDGGGAGGIVIGAVEDAVAVDGVADAEVVEMGGEEDDFFGGGRRGGVLGAAEEGDGIPGVGADILVEALFVQVAVHAVAELGNGGALYVAAVFLGDAGERLEAEGLEEAGGELGGEVFVAGGGAAAVELVGGEVGFVGTDTGGADASLGDG